MPSMKDVRTFKDSTTFTLKEAHLTKKKCVETEKRDIPSSDGLQWWARYHPAGDRDAAKNYISLYVCFNKPVTATYTFAVNNAFFNYTHTYKFKKSPFGVGYYQYASHEKLRPLFRDGKLTITCSIETDIEVPFVLSVPRVFQLFDHVPTDVEIVVGSKKIQAHKNFISLISPVFNSMFSNDTAESKPDVASIIDFDYDTVKAALDICHGRELEKCSLDTMVPILRFSDKYSITAISKQFEKLPSLNLSVATFCTIVHYAYDCNKDALFTECCNFFKDHQNYVKVTDKFAQLPPALVTKVLKSAFDLKTDFDVLRHAHKNDIAFVVEHLERPYLSQITIENFCPVVDYAWNCSRDDLKKVCTKFFNENIMDVMNLKDFHELPAELVRQVIEVRHTLNHGAN